MILLPVNKILINLKRTPKLDAPTTYLYLTIKMAACCTYNGTCSECTNLGLDWARTRRNLTCCCSDPLLVPDTVTQLATSPGQCPSAPKIRDAHTGLIIAVVLGCIFIIIFIAYILKKHGVRCNIRKKNVSDTEPLLTDFSEREGVYNIEMTTIL